MSIDAIKQRINDKILALMADVITEEELTKMVEDSIDKFFNSKDPNGGHEVVIREDYNVRGAKAHFVVSPFELMVWEKMMPIAQKAITDVFKAESDAIQSRGQEIIEAKVKENYGSIVGMAASMQELSALKSLGGAMDLISMCSMNAMQSMARGDVSSAMSSMNQIGRHNR